MPATGARRLPQLLSVLRRGVVGDDDLDEAFAALRAVVGASGIFVVQDNDFRAWNRASGVPEEWKREHPRLRAADPSIRVVTRSPAGTFYNAQRDFAPEDFHSEIYERFRACGLRDVTLAKVYSPFRDDLFFGLYRDDRPFRARELALLDLVYPHLAGALATRRALALLGLERLPHMRRPPPAATIAFPSGEVSLDAAARHAIERRVGRVGKLGWPRVHAAIAVAARRFTLAGPGGRSQVLWPGLRIDFAVVPPERGESARLVGFLVDEGTLPAPAADHPTPPLVAALLSPQQLAIARDFAAGMTVSAIAEARRIGAETVRSHLRASYEKLRVSTRAALGRALAG